MTKSMKIMADQGQLFPLVHDVVQRSDVGPGGALGLWDGFGKLMITVEDKLVMVLQVRENGSGEAVVRATVPDDVPSVATNARAGDFVEANLERAHLVGTDETSRHRGWAIDPTEMK